MESKATFSVASSVVPRDPIKFAGFSPSEDGICSRTGTSDLPNYIQEKFSGRARLLKTRRGEVAERLKAAVC